jgi:transcriptional regulator with GAF, ATPase, and Fis domain
MSSELPKDERGFWKIFCHIFEQSPHFAWIITILILAQTGVLIYGNKIKKEQTKQINTQIELMNKISKLVHKSMQTDANQNIKYRILVILRYENTWYRNLLLISKVLFSTVKIKDIDQQYYNDRFITIAGYGDYSPTLLVTEGISFSADSVTKKVFLEGKPKCENVTPLPDTTKELKSVLAVPIMSDGVCIGTLNMDSTKEKDDTTFCSLDNTNTLNLFAEIMASIIDDKREYMSYISTRYMNHIVKNIKSNSQ